MFRVRQLAHRTRCGYYVRDDGWAATLRGDLARMQSANQDPVACNLCGGQETMPWCAALGERVVRCVHCGLVYTCPRPSPEQLRARYQTSYVDRHQDAALAAQRRQMYQLERQTILRLVPGGRFLDIGCGTGEFLALMSDRFEVYGVDVCEGYVEYGRQHLGLTHLALGELHDAGFPDSYFDVVQMRGVLQHLADPLGAAREALRVTRPGGLLVVSATPNIASLCARLYRHHFRLLAPDYMLYNFSPTTLRRLLTRAGWEVRRIAFPYMMTPYFRWWQGLEVLIDAVWMVVQGLPGVPPFDRRSPPFYGNMMTCYAWRPPVPR